MLAELETDEQQLKLNEERSRLAALAPQIEAVTREIAAEQQAINDARQANRGALEEARARVAEADAAAQYAEEEAKRLSDLFREGYIAELVVLRAKADSKSRRAAAESLKHSVSKLESQQQTQETERNARIDKLLREKSELEGQGTTSAATIGRLQNDIEKRTIRAPVSGQLGEVTNSKSGAVLREGDKLGTVVPSGELKIVAEFPPSALGRIGPGQSARMRLTSFPWTQFGSLPATVTKVAGELRDGKIRVELGVHGKPSTIPLQHGLPGTVEVEVERVTPARLLLRALKFLSRPSREEQGQRSAG